jgi:hypothetical protein
MIPQTKVLRISGHAKGAKHYVVKCPYCENQHYHGVKGGLGNRVRHCIDARFMPVKTRQRFLLNCIKYEGCSTYDIIN